MHLFTFMSKCGTQINMEDIEDLTTVMGHLKNFFDQCTENGQSVC